MNRDAIEFFGIGDFYREHAAARDHAVDIESGVFVLPAKRRVPDGEIDRSALACIDVVKPMDQRGIPAIADSAPDILGKAADACRAENAGAFFRREGILARSRMDRKKLAIFGSYSAFALADNDSRAVRNHVFVAVVCTVRTGHPDRAGHEHIGRYPAAHKASLPLIRRRTRNRCEHGFEYSHAATSLVIELYHNIRDGTSYESIMYNKKEPAAIPADTRRAFRCGITVHSAHSIRRTAPFCRSAPRITVRPW